MATLHSLSNDAAQQMQTPHEYSGRSSYIVLYSSASGMSKLESFITRLKDEWHINQEIFMNIHVAVSEAVLGAMIHTHTSTKERSVRVSAIHEKTGYTFSIEDDNRSSDLFLHKEFYLPQNRRVLIIKRFADAIHYSVRGHRLYLFFSTAKSLSDLYE